MICPGCNRELVPTRPAALYYCTECNTHFDADGNPRKTIGRLIGLGSHGVQEYKDGEDNLTYRWKTIQAKQFDSQERKAILDIQKAIIQRAQKWVDELEMWAAEVDLPISVSEAVLSEAHERLTRMKIWLEGS